MTENGRLRIYPPKKKVKVNCIDVIHTWAMIFGQPSGDCRE